MDYGRVLIAGGEANTRKVLSEALGRQGHGVAEVQDGREAIELCRSQRFSIVFADCDKAGGLEVLRQVRQRCPDTPVVLMSGAADAAGAIEAMKGGAFDFLLKPVSAELIGEVARRAMLSLSRKKEVSSGKPFLRPIITCDPKMLSLLELAKNIAPSRATVLVTGESGTGKELFARHVHAHSGRGQRPFIAVNCAALPESLLESELFGHEKGAFTGAVMRKAGKFELANGGTLLLDEVSEMKQPLQAKLLRVLQEGEVDRVGGREPVPVDVRVVATSNRDLEKLINEGGFREDLYYRLNVIPIKLPPLRERPGDVEPLVEHFLRKYRKADGRTVEAVSKEAMELLSRAPWRGNVRELENVIERAVLVSANGTLLPEHLFPEQLAGKEPLGATSEDVPGVPGQKLPLSSLRDMEKRLIRASLAETGGNRTHAARILGISVRTLRNKLNEYRRELGPALAETA